MRQKLQGLGNQDSLFCASPPGLGATPLHLHLHGAGRGGGIHSPASAPGRSLHSHVKWPAGLQGEDISG